MANFWDQDEVVAAAPKTKEWWAGDEKPTPTELNTAASKALYLEDARADLKQAWFPNAKAAMAGIGESVLGPIYRATRNELQADMSHRISSAYQQAAEELNASEDNIVPAWVKRAGRGVATSVPTMVLASRAAGTTGAIGLAGIQEGDRAITEGKDAGLKGRELAAYAASQAAIESSIALISQGIANKLGISSVEKMAGGQSVSSGVRSAIKEVTKSTALEIPEELITEIGHNVASAVSGVNPNATTPEALMQTAFDTTMQTIATGGLLGGVQVAGAAGPRSQQTFYDSESGQELNSAKVETFIARPTRANADAAGIPRGNAESRQAEAERLREVLATSAAQQYAPAQGNTDETADFAPLADTAEFVPAEAPASPTNQPLTDEQMAEIKARQEAEAARVVNQRNDTPVNEADLLPPTTEQAADPTPETEPPSLPPELAEATEADLRGFLKSLGIKPPKPGKNYKQRLRDAALSAAWSESGLGQPETTTASPEAITDDVAQPDSEVLPVPPLQESQNEEGQLQPQIEQERQVETKPVQEQPQEVAYSLGKKEFGNRRGFITKRERADLLRSAGLDPNKHTQAFMRGWKELEEAANSESEKKLAQDTAPYMELARELSEDDASEGEIFDKAVQLLNEAKEEEWQDQVRQNDEALAEENRQKESAQRRDVRWAESQMQSASEEAARVLSGDERRALTRQDKRGYEADAQMPEAHNAMLANGWEFEYASGTGSYYYRRGSERFRVSDHAVPATAEREYNKSIGGLSWSDTENQIILPVSDLASEFQREEVANLPGVEAGTEASPPAWIQEASESDLRKYLKAEGVKPPKPGAKNRERLQDAAMKTWAATRKPVQQADVDALVDEAVGATGLTGDQQSGSVQESQQPEISDGERNRTRSPAAQGVGANGRNLASRAIPGKTSKLALAGESPREVRYHVIEDDGIIPSHDARQNFRRNPLGDKNERPYHDAKEGMSSRMMVEDIAKADPAKLELLTSDTLSATDGPPIVNSEGVVLGGNARSMGVQLAYHNGGEVAARMKQAMVRAAEKFGIDPATVEGMSRPVIVRELPNSGSRGELSSLLNEPLTAGKSRATIAASRGDRVSETTAAMLSDMMSPNSEGDIPSVRDILRSPTNADRILNALLSDGALTARDVDQYVEPDTGLFNDGGKSAIEEMLLGKVVGDPSIVGDMAPSTRNKVLSSLGPIVRGMSDKKHGKRLSQAIRDAIESLPGFHASGQTADMYFLHQQTMLNDAPGMGDETVAILADQLIKLGPVKLRAAIKEINSALGVESGSKQSTMFGGEQTADSVDDAVADHFGRLIKKPAQAKTTGLTGQPQPESVQRQTPKPAAPKRGQGPLSKAIRAVKKGEAIIKEDTPPLPPEPTTARPGSPERLAIMRERVAQGYAAIHPLDAGTKSDLALAIAPSSRVFTDMGRDFRKSLAAGKRFLKNFTSAGMLPKNVFAFKEGRDKWLASELKQMEFNKKDFDLAVRELYGNNLTQQQQELIDDALKGKSSNIPPTLRTPLKVLRDHVDALSRRLIASGAVDGPLTLTIDQNLGTYLTRSYRVFDDPQWAEKVPEDVRNAARAFIRAEYPTYNHDQIEATINNLLYNPEAPMAYLAGSRLGSKDLSITKRRKNVPPEIRALLGEYRDPRVNYIRSVTKMANLIANHEFLANVRQDGLGSIFFEKDDPNITPEHHAEIAAPSSSVMAPLNGLWTTPEIRDAFEKEFTSKDHNAVVKAYLKANALTKYGKTVLSPQSQVRNFISNALIAVAQGHWHASKFRDALKGTAVSLGWNNTQQWRSYYRDAVSKGVVDESVHAGELRDATRDAMDMTPEEFSDHTIRRIVKSGSSLAQKIYQASDNFWKIYAWENEKSRYREAYPNWTDEQVSSHAAEIVRNTYPTYSKISKNVKAVRNFPLTGTFVSFPAEIIRTSGHTLNTIRKELSDPATRSIGAQRLAGVLAAATIPATAALVSRMMFGVSADDEEDVRKFVAPWQENSDLVWLSGVADGKGSFVDLSFTDPYNYIRNPVKALMRGEDFNQSLKDAAWELLEPFAGEEILAKALIEAKTNKKEGGGQIYNEQAPVSDQLGEQVAYVWNKALEPGGITSLRRIAKGINGTVEDTGRTYNPATETLAVISGFRPVEIDIRQGLGYRARNYQRSSSEAERQVISVANSRGTVTEQDLANAYESAEASRKALFEDMHKQAQSAIRLGATTYEVAKILNDGGVPKQEVPLIIAGRYTPYFFSKPTIASIRQKDQGADRILQVRALYAKALQE